MQKIRVSEVLEIVKGNVNRKLDDFFIEGISTDTRSIKQGDLFIPIHGENFDGHRFIDEAFKKGASVSLAECGFSQESENNKIIFVDDTISAYHRLAYHSRKSFKIPVIAITGSNGKTTTKDLTADILSSRYKVLKTPANFNNEIGVPQTLLKLDEKTDMLVIELAMRGSGQIKQLADIVKPNIAIITNIGEAHYELLGSYQAIADAKAELLESLPSDGIAVLNADDKWFSYLRTKFNGRIISFGENNEADLCLLSYEALGIDGFKIHIMAFDKQEYYFVIPIMGFHNVYNCLAAICIALLHNVGERDIQEILNNSVITGKRMEKLVTDDGVIIINDAYNASPKSVDYAVKTLGMLKDVGKKYIVLGDMRELGEISENSHRSIGRLVSEAGVDYLITLGEMGKWIYEEAISSGMDSTKCLWYEDRQEAMRNLNGFLNPGDVVLVKASRLMKLEEVVDYIIEHRKNKVYG